MGNYRGTLYSKRHVSLSPEEEKFWDFSFHEMAIYDLKALINYVRITANVPQIIYIGYSIGGTTSFIYGSLRPEEAASSIKVVINLAPGVYFRHSTAPYTFTILPFIHFVVVSKLESV
ncbi:Abhydrolase 1 domain containing protein [Asbolus verrucosus]|uniref:Abhydrolase 1 domain containing protein n=1 Tax=Asbolus verrucosus TaxID=1661398 RepID=A0A482W5G1_ASBVE|nr:Abhydrolase 1 domain containing protein [Asbolus verrucosus]